MSYSAPHTSGRYPSPKWSVRLSVYEHRRGGALALVQQETYQVRAKKARTAVSRVIYEWQSAYRRRIRPGFSLHINGVRKVK